MASLLVLAGGVGLCSAEASCGAVAADGIPSAHGTADMKDCGESGPEWVDPCCCSGDLTSDQATIARATTLLADTSENTSFGTVLPGQNRAPLEVDRAWQPPSPDRQALLCTYVI